MGMWGLPATAEARPAPGGRILPDPTARTPYREPSECGRLARMPDHPAGIETHTFSELFPHLSSAELDEALVNLDNFLGVVIRVRGRSISNQSEERERDQSLDGSPAR